ncbi:FtsX-like permease family protein [Fictibacillus enclensis]|uniref:ABC transporter permease n=1 Tax=Fictibacillus enclensis TaxID=1017270 RepID=UPI0025A29B5D|nr:ABC transporter permease [Fictibacillus enclensis]MDM5200431.1 FtsX-like permease family protein [Fictibacillus enclensis]
MKFKDRYRFVRANMKKNKTRVIMTVLAATMGCAFLIVLASIGFGIHKTAIKDITNGRLMTEIEVHGEKPFTRKDIQKLDQLKNTKTVTRKQIVENNLTYRLDKYESHSETMVADIPAEKKAGFELSKGRMPIHKNEIIVGYDFAQGLAKQIPDEETKNLSEKELQNKLKESQYKGDLLGKTVQLEIQQMKGKRMVKKNFSLTIVGIGKKPSKQWMLNESVFISEGLLKDIERFTKTPRGIMNLPENKPIKMDYNVFNHVKVYTHTADEVEGVSEKIEKMGYSTYSAQNELKQINVIFLIIKIGLITVGTVAVLIASIGIFNTMTMAVTERAQDIGIMKAIGAHPGVIKKIFLMESSFIGIMGALIGTAIAYLFSYGVNLILPLLIEQFFHEKPPENFYFSYIPVSLPLICISICFGVTLISGLRPAVRATQVDVLKALRRDI